MGSPSDTELFPLDELHGTGLPLRTIVGSSSAPGVVSRVNQDAMRVGFRDSVCVVADGIGGGAYGDVYSKVAANVLVESYESGSTLEEAYVAAAVATNTLSNWLHEKDGGTTVVAFTLSGNDASVLWCGDAMAYYVRAGQVIPMSIPDRAPDSNRLTKALGSRGIPDAHAATIKAHDGDLFVLATDGVWDEIGSDGIFDAVRSAHALPAAMAAALVERPDDGRVHDDATAIVVSVFYDYPSERS